MATIICSDADDTFEMPLPGEEIYIISRKMKENSRLIAYFGDSHDVEIVYARFGLITVGMRNTKGEIPWHGIAHAVHTNITFPRPIPISKENVAKTKEEAIRLLELFQKNGLYVHPTGCVKAGTNNNF